MGTSCSQYVAGQMLLEGWEPSEASGRERTMGNRGETDVLSIVHSVSLPPQSFLASASVRDLEGSSPPFWHVRVGQ